MRGNSRKPVLRPSLISPIVPATELTPEQQQQRDTEWQIIWMDVYDDLRKAMAKLRSEHQALMSLSLEERDKAAAKIDELRKELVKLRNDNQTYSDLLMAQQAKVNKKIEKIENWLMSWKRNGFAAMKNQLK